MGVHSRVSMKLGTVIVALVLASQAAASSGAPAGFWANARLAGPAAFVAGKPVTVYCAPTQAAINATVSPTATNIQGATKPGGSDIYLSPLSCANLDAWLNGKKVELYNFAGALETFAHEAELASGISDETTATCKGIPKIPRLVTKYFPLKGRESLHDLMGDVHDVWMSQTAVYHAHPC